MCADDNSFEGMDEMIRSIARELSRSVVERVGDLDIEEIASSVGVDPALAREWVDNAGRWLSEHAENLGGPVSFEGAWSTDQGIDEDPLRRAEPHPLDLPTGEQGLALAALDSGRWTVEPGSNALAAQAEGPGPTDALGLVRELHARDWINADGDLTLAGRHALGRWLDATQPR